jgi:hypothetical protein
MGLSPLEEQRNSNKSSGDLAKAAQNLVMRQKLSVPLQVGHGVTVQWCGPLLQTLRGHNDHHWSIRTSVEDCSEHIADGYPECAAQQ